MVRETWIGEQARIYFDNAGLTREYRTQLRGIKAPLFLTAYLGLFVLLASVFYFGVTFATDRSIASVQQQLRTFYGVIVGMLEFLVGLVAPVLAAASIVGEYQRQSVDLLFSSPVGPKYFLVGKLLASYRYVLLLLALTLPVSAVCVVLGGATWGDVTATYLLVSFHGLVYMSISVPVAVMTAKAVPTVMWSYVAGITYGIVAMMINVPLMSGLFMGASSTPPLLGLTPFMATLAGSGWIPIGAIQVPLWLITGVITLVFTRLMIVGAGSALTQAGSKEAFNLRTTGLLLCLVVPAMVGFSMGGGTRIPFSSTGSDIVIGLWFLSMPLLICLPHLSTWAGSGGAKALPNGWWKPQLLLRGTPASGLPYLTSLLVCLVAGAAFTSLSNFDVKLLLYLGGFFATWFLAWSLGWLASGATWRSGIEASRRLHVLLLFLIFAIPPIAFGVVEAALRQQGVTLPEGWGEKFVLFTFPWNPVSDASYKVLIIAVLGLLVFFFAERKRRNAVDLMRSPV